MAPAGDQSGPKSPRTSTIKRLFALSRNQCAFPKCTAPMVDPGGTVVGEICHIKAEKEGGPRHDKSQSDEERHGFDNLIVMCSTHHTVIDDDEDAYSVERLLSMKKQHEEAAPAIAEPTDEIAQQFITNIAKQVNVQGGSYIDARWMMGGQAAHSITNVGPQPRQFTQAAANELISALRRLPPMKITVTAVWGDGEAFQLAHNLQQVLSAAGWECEGVDQAMYTTPTIGVILRCDPPSFPPAMNVLAQWLVAVGFGTRGKVTAWPRSSGEPLELIVGNRL